MPIRPPMTFYDLITRHAATQGDKAAFYDRDKPVTYKALLAEVDRTSLLLTRQGARAGDRLALWLPNCTAWLAVFLAAARLGMITVAMNTRFRSHEVGDILHRTRCTMLVMWSDFKGIDFPGTLNDVEADTLGSLETIIDLGGSQEYPRPPRLAGTRWVAYNAPVPADRDSEKQLDSAPDAPVLVYSTSGTTSAAKLVLHQQSRLIQHGRDASAALGIDENGVVLLGAPLCGAFGFSTALAALAAGATLVSTPTLEVRETARLIRQCGVTHTFANNELIDRLLKAGSDASPPFPTLKTVGFATFSPSLADLPATAQAAGLTLIGLYGSSELHALAAAQDPAAPAEERLRSGGRLVSPQARVRIYDVDTREALAPGQIGALYIASPNAMMAYLDDPQATTRAFRDGYFDTGDLAAAVDERSFVYYGRQGDFMRLSGFLVNPREIEAYIESLDAVHACQVIALDHHGKYVPIAFVIAKAGRDIDEQDIISACQQHLARYKVPLRVFAIEAFPVVESANSNKIQRSRLQELARRLMAGSG